MSKKADQQAARRARLLKHMLQPVSIEAQPRVFPPVREPFCLPDLLGFTPPCWQGDCPENKGGPVIRADREGVR